MKIYLAGPLFTLAEREFNSKLAAELNKRSSFYDIILPQLKAAELLGSPDFIGRMYKYCVDMVSDCDCVVAILDGADADSGTCIEVGRAAALGKPVIGVRTDLRESEDRGLNLMVANSCTELVVRPNAEVEGLADTIHGLLQRVLDLRDS